MPIFEYVCQKCQHRFEKIIHRDAIAVRCPSCESKKVERQLSVFAAGIGNEKPPAAMTGCGTCGDPRGPGACSLN